MAKAKDYLSLIKFSHTVFAMPFAIIGFLIGVKESAFFATEHFWILFAKVIVCMITARTAAMAFNRYIDRKFDALNPRTAIREIPSNIITPNQALILTILSALAFIATTFFINPLCFYLSPIALLVILGYSLTKRFTALCHLILGIGLGLAPVGAFLAVAGHFDFIPVIFGFVVVFWVSGFDMLYALQDEDFDRAQNLFSIPVWIGRKYTLILSTVLHLLAIAGVLIAGWLSHFGIIYWIGTLSFSGLLIYQHLILKPTDISRINLAFATLNGISSIIFACFFLADFIIH